MHWKQTFSKNCSSWIYIIQVWQAPPLTLTPLDGSDQMIIINHTWFQWSRLTWMGKTLMNIILPIRLGGIGFLLRHEKYSKLQTCPDLILYSISANSPSKQQGGRLIVIEAKGSVKRVIMYPPSEQQVGLYSRL